MVLYCFPIRLNAWHIKLPTFIVCTLLCDECTKCDWHIIIMCITESISTSIMVLIKTIGERADDCSFSQDRIVLIFFSMQLATPTPIRVLCVSLTESGSAVALPMDNTQS